MDNPGWYILGFSILTAAFVVFRYFKDPQVKSDQNDALLEQSVSQLQKDFANVRDNHLHTIDTKLDQTTLRVNELAIQVAKLSTIIDERIPRKQL